MSNRSKGNAPRQPLSRQRPAASRGKAAAKRAAPARGTAAKRGTPAGAAAKRPTRPAKATSKPRASRPSALGPGPSAAPDPAAIYERLAAAYPDAHCALDFRDAYELLVATILSAQCTDRRVNMVTPALFARYPNAAALAAARQEEVEELVRSTGFFRNKAKNIIAMANALVDLHGGTVPADMDALTKLPGVGRKTANVILGNAFGRNEGVVVDTHVGRLSRRLGLADSDDPVKIEQQLMALFPRERWTMLAHLLIEHGRQICDAKKPKCAACVLRDICPSAGRVP